MSGQAEHVLVPHRIHQTERTICQTVFPPLLPDHLSGPRMAGEEDRLPVGLQGPQERFQAIPRARALLPVQGHHQVGLLGPGEGAASLQGGPGGVQHQVPHLVDASGDPLAGQMLDGHLAGGEEQRREAVGQDPVDLLGHRREAAQSGLDVGHGEVQLGGCQGGGQGGVGVPEDHDQVGGLGHQDLFDLLQHPAGHGPVAGAAHAQVVVRGRQLQLLEEDLRHVLVVVLAGVDHAGPAEARQEAGQRGQLYELGSGSDHQRQASHSGTSVSVDVRRGSRNWAS